jgi:hypothetical protein
MRKIAEFLRVLHVLQKGNHFPDFLYYRRVQTGRVVHLDEAPQAAMPHTLDCHESSLSDSIVLCQVTLYALPLRLIATASLGAYVE